MDSLPFEILLQILHYLPPTDSKTARLACRTFNAALAKQTFGVLASFIDPAVATATLEDMAADLRRRPRAIWSPRCSVPDGLPIPESFLLAMRVALTGSSWLGTTARRAGGIEWGDGEDDNHIQAEAQGDVEMERHTAHNFGRWIGRDEITEDMIRQALFRYALYLSYIYEGAGEAPQLWVVKTKLWMES